MTGRRGEAGRGEEGVGRLGVRESLRGTEISSGGQESRGEGWFLVRVLGREGRAVGRLRFRPGAEG